ncbi:hypothetical protein ABW19_dt0209710 [Dactylella cylindrospora]|nr:hypothetical protein ABW19_dt0209710 [Dactylella cylindrospora]
MYLPAAILALLAVSASAAPALEVNQCAVDNCLRAVRASAFPTRSGTSDCSSYLRTTVTPAVVTVTVTNTASATASATDSVVQIDTILETATETEHQTAIATFSLTHTVTTTKYADLVKRQETSAPSVIPSYASACSGAVRYSSACSCVGVLPTTVTLPASTSTVYADETTTVATETKTITVATQYTTIIDGTTTVQTTDATSTIPVVVATTTHTVTIALEDAFALRIENGANAGWFVGYGGPRLYGIASANQEPRRFYMKDEITYSYETNRPLQIWGSGTRGSYVQLDNDAYQYGYLPANSTINSNGEHHITLRGWDQWWSCKDNNEYGRTTMHAEGPTVQGIGQGNPCEKVTVRAVRWEQF